MNTLPLSRVIFTQLQINEYIAFKPNALARLLKSESTNPEVLKDLVKKYVDKHPDIIRYIKKPTGYMIAEVIPYDENKDIDTALKDRYACNECKDLKLLILVFCSTVNDLYIPNRNLTFDSTKFNKILLFPSEEVKQ